MRTHPTRLDVWLRGFLYIAIAVVTELVPSLASGQPINWALMSCKLILAAMVTLRSYIDKTPSEHKEGEAAQQAAQADKDTAN